MTWLAATRKEEADGLIHATAVNPFDLVHPVHNGCDEGLKCVKISVCRQLPEDIGEVEARIAEGHLHQHLLQNSGTNLA